MIIPVVNNKGGTGKTTTAVNLSAALACREHRVLLCDLDPQASASLSLGIPYHSLSPSLFEILFEDTPVEECIRKTSLPGLHLITGSIHLASADLMLAERQGREWLLAEKLREVYGKYEYIVVDCAPSLSMLQINAISAGEGILIPLHPEYLALEGLVSLRDSLERIRTGMGINPRILGIVFTLVNASLSPVISRELREQIRIMELLREYAPGDVFNTIIKRDIKLAEAPSYGKSVMEYDPGGKSARIFSRLSEEVISRKRHSDKINAAKGGRHAI